MLSNTVNGSVPEIKILSPYVLSNQILVIKMVPFVRILGYVSSMLFMGSV